MDKLEIESILSEIQYPKLNKTIIELDLIASIMQKEDHLDISLKVNNDEAFEELVLKIKKSKLQDHYKSIHVINQTHSKKQLNYGHTSNPNNRAPYAKKVIAVTSGKGGVGKSTVSVNLSVALAQKGLKVGLLDADVYGPNIPRMMGVAHESLVWNEHNKIVPSENFGVKMMSVGLTTPKADTPLVWRSSVAISALMQFLEDVQWGELDFLVIDMPPGTGDVQLTMAQELPIATAVIVTTPQMVSIDDVSRAIMMFKDVNIPIGGLVENMSYFIAPDTKKEYKIFGEGAGEETAVKYQIPFLGKIPMQMSFCENSDNGMPIVAVGTEEEKAYYREIVANLFKSL